MYTNGSEEFNRLIETPNNKAIQKRLVFEDTGRVIDKFKTLIMYSSSNNQELQIGTTNMSYLDVEAFTDIAIFDGQKLRLECGVELSDGSMEYAPMGVFTAVNTEKGLNSVKFTANDNMQKTEKLYASSLTYPATSDKIIEEICEICEIELATPIENPITVTEKLQGYTCREVLGFIAGIHGKFACFDRLGQLNLRWYSEIPIEKQNSLIWSFTKSQEPFIVDKIEIAKNTETKFTSGEGNNTIYHSNPLATQQITDNILDDLRGFSYSTSKIEMLDDIRLDIWDVIKVTYLDGNEYLIPCMSIRQNMGASSTYIESFSKSKIQNQYKYEGPTAQFINRMATELLITNRVVASKVDADYVQSHAITTDNLEAIKADIKYAVIEDLDADFITTEELEAESAVIKVAVVQELSAEFGDIKQLKSDVAKIDTLIFGTASGDVIQTTFANSVIAQLGDAQIKSAMIQDVSASKITAGTIYTNDVTIQSKNGQMMLKDNTIQISDGTRARVQIGKDASNDYSINVWDKSGNLMFSQGGITDKAIKSAIIRNDMVSENANIHAGKLDISSLFTEINKSSNTIKANRIYLDEQKQTLEVSFKSMTTTVDGLKQTQTSQGTQLEVLNGQISSKIWKQDITTAVKDINIGGTNILRDTKTMTTKNGFVLASATITIEDDGSGYYIATLPADSKWDSVNFYLQQNMNDVIGKTATLSFDAKSDGLTLTTNQWTVVAAVFNKTNNRLKGATIAYLHNADKFNVNEYVDGEWVRCRVTFVFPSTEEMTSYEEGEISKYGLQIFSSTDNDQYPLQIRKVKCEFGNKATDWTPAPEDTEFDITSLTTKYSTLEQDVDSFKTTVSATYSTKTELQTTKSTLEQTINSFKTTVSETYTTLDDFNNLNVGGRNLLLNSKTFSKTTTQNQTNQAINIGNFSDYFMSERAVGKQITVSFDWTTTATSGKFQILFNNTPWATIFPNSTVTISSSNKSGRVEYTATLTDAAVNSSALYTGLRIRIDNIEGTTTVSNVKCEFGNKATDWTPAPEDIDSNIAEINTKYSSLEQNIEGFKTTVSSTYTTKTEFNSLSIGGTNILPDSNISSLTAVAAPGNRFFSDSGSATTAEFITVTDAPISEIKVGIKMVTVASAAGRNLSWRNIRLQDGETYTISLYARSLDSEQMEFRFRYQVNGGSYISKYVTVQLDNTWKKISYTIKIEKSKSLENATTDLYVVGVAGVTSKYVGTVEMCGFKMELGDKATAWSYALEDVTTSVETTQTIATQTADKFNWLVKSGTSSSDFTLTDRMAELTASIISLNGNVKVNGNMIVDSAITADKIAANSITANKMAIGDFSNLAVINPDNYNPNNYTINTDAEGVKWFKFGSDTTLGYYSVYMNYLPANTVFNKGDKYIFRALVKASMVTSVGFRLRVFYSDGASPTYTNMASTFVDDLPTAQEYRQIQFTVNTLPTAGRPIKNIGLFLETRNTKLGTIYVRELTVHRMTNNVLIADGAITADKINVSDLFAQDIVASGSITSPVLKSSDYAYSSGDYSSKGMIVDLKNKLLRTPKVAIKPNGSIVAKDGTFTGTVNASEGKIGNITIQKNQGLYYSPTTASGFGLWATTEHDNIAFHAGANNSNIGGAPFRIYHDGSVVAGDLTAGNVNLTGGKIGNWSITDGILIGTGNGRRMALYPNGQTFNINGTSTTDIFFLVVYGDGGKIFGLTINGVIKTING